MQVKGDTGVDTFAQNIVVNAASINGEMLLLLILSWTWLTAKQFFSVYGNESWFYFQVMPFGLRHQRFRRCPDAYVALGH